MTTARDIIQDAVEIIQVYASGEVMTDADAQRALVRLNNMLDSWSNESLTCYAILEQNGVLVANKQTYTIGAGGDFNLTRPLRLIDGPGAAYILDTNNNRYPLDVIPQDKWNMIGLPSAQSNIPDTLFYDPQFPLGKLNFFPVPNAQNFTAYWDSYLQLTDFVNLTASLSLPPGYELAIKANLAVNLIPYFGTGRLSPQELTEIKDQARETKANIKRTNTRMMEAVFDPEIVSSVQPVYNIYRDRGGA